MNDQPLKLRDLLGDFADRRRDIRYPCQLEGLIESDQGSVPCQITSLSRGGLSVRGAAGLAKAEPVTVRLLAQDQFLQCRVEWMSSDTTARLSLLPESSRDWLDQELQRLSRQAKEVRQRRGGVRIKCHLPAHLEWDDDTCRSVTILDLGTTGARVECAGEGIPEKVRLRFGLPDCQSEMIIDARTVSSHDALAGHHGLTFDVSSATSQQLSDFLKHLFASKSSK